MVKVRAPKEIAPDLLTRIQQRFGGFPLIQGWGLAIEALEPGQATLSIAPSVATTNGPTGVINGGVLATLADMACAVALSTGFDGRMPFATSDLHIRYLEPVVEKVVIVATVIRASLRSGVVECRILCGARVLVLCTAQFSIKPQEHA